MVGCDELFSVFNLSVDGNTYCILIDFRIFLLVAIYYRDDSLKATEFK